MHLFRPIALSGLLFFCYTAAAIPLPVRPPESVATEKFITQVNSDNSVTWRLWAPSAKAVEVVTGATPDRYLKTSKAYGH